MLTDSRASDWGNEPPEVLCAKTELEWAPCAGQGETFESYANALFLFDVPSPVQRVIWRFSSYVIAWKLQLTLSGVPEEPYGEHLPTWRQPQPLT